MKKFLFFIFTIFVLSNFKAHTEELNYIRIVRDPPVYFDTLQDAYDSSATGETIQLQSVWFPESLECDRAVSVVIEGGYNQDFSAAEAYSYLLGQPEITLGTVKLKNIVVTGTGLSFLPSDSAPPSGSVLIEDNHTYINTVSVTLTLSAQDGISGIDEMSLSNDNSNWSTPETYAGAKAWDLTAGDGTKTVYVKFSDRAGNWSGSFSDSIDLSVGTDETAPQITAVSPDDNSTYYEGENIEVSLSVSDSDGGTPVEYRFSLNAEIVQDWSADSDYLWPAEPGKHIFLAETWDPGGSDYRQREVYVYRVPVETPNLLPVRLTGSTTAYYDTIQEAYNAAASGDTINLLEQNFEEDLSCNRAISVTIEGGYKTTFYSKGWGKSTIVGMPHISDGTVTLKNIVITGN